VSGVARFMSGDVSNNSVYEWARVVYELGLA
jgi:hypothetical protein